MRRPDPTPRVKVVAATLGAALAETFLGLADWLGAPEPPRDLTLSFTVLCTFAFGWVVREPRP